MKLLTLLVCPFLVGGKDFVISPREMRTCRGLFGIWVYAMHGIYMFISTTKICQVKVVDG